MRTICVQDGTILLGKQGEHEAAQVRFDVSAWLDTYGEGTPELLVRRSGDAVPYPAVVTRGEPDTEDADSVFWVLSSADTAKYGYGECELRWYINNKLAKSRTWLTRTLPTIDPGEMPDAYQSWVDDVLQAGADATASAAAAALSESNASASEIAAALSESNVSASEIAAAASEQAAKESEQSAAESAAAAAADAASTMLDAEKAEAQANRAQAEADRATVPAVSGLYNLILTDRVLDSVRYALYVESGIITLVTVNPDYEASEDVDLIDKDTGIVYQLIAENGILKLEEVG